MNIGFKKIVYSVGNEAQDGTIKYNGVHAFRGARTFSVEPENENASFYEEDVRTETSSTFIKAGLTFEVGRLYDEVRQDVFGMQGENGDLLMSNAVPPIVGIGLLIPTIEENVTKFAVLMFPKVKFSLPNLDVHTREETTEYRGIELLATIFARKNDHLICLHRKVDTEQAGDNAFSNFFPDAA